MNEFAQPRGNVHDPINLTTGPQPEAHQEEMDLNSATDELWGVVGTLSMLEVIHIDDEEARQHLWAAKHHLRAYLLPAAELGQEPEPELRAWEDEADVERRAALLDLPAPEQPHITDEMERQARITAEQVEARRRQREEVPAYVAAELENTVAYPDAVTSTITSSDLPEPEPGAFQREMDAHDARVEGR